MDTIFYICVKIMQVMSNFMGISYQQLNVILFVLLHPAITIYLFVLYKMYKKRYNEVLKKEEQHWRSHLQ